MGKAKSPHRENRRSKNQTRQSAKPKAQTNQPKTISQVIAGVESETTGGATITRLPASVVVNGQNKGARDSRLNPRNLTINHGMMGSHRERVEGQDGGNGKAPRYNRGKAGAVLVEPALVYIPYNSGVISELQATGKGFHLSDQGGDMACEAVEAITSHHNNY